MKLWTLIGITTVTRNKVSKAWFTHTVLHVNDCRIFKKSWVSVSNSAEDIEGITYIFLLCKRRNIILPRYFVRLVRDANDENEILIAEWISTTNLYLEFNKLKSAVTNVGANNLQVKLQRRQLTTWRHHFPKCSQYWVVKNVLQMKNLWT